MEHRQSLHMATITNIMIKDMIFYLFHELAHEWWGNYLSVSDWADFWIHEGFAIYSEALF